MNSDDKVTVIVCVIGLMLIFGLAFGCNYIKSSFEASTYNKLTGKNVSAWDAMWVDLRVQENIQE